MKYHKLYTVGYGGMSDPGELVRLAHSVKAGVVDIRFVPMSRRACWAFFDLRSAVESGGVSYLSIRDLGNVNFREASKPIELSSPERGMVTLLARLEVGNQILLCGCKDFRACHRLVVGQLAEARGVAVVHWEREEPVGAAPQLELF